MPRRATPDPTARAVGGRIRALRSERRLTAERLAFESEIGSKGFLSDIEQGRAIPSITTLRYIADYLEVRLVDLFTFPEESERDALIDRTRWLTAGAIRKLLREMPAAPERPEPAGGVAGGRKGPAKTHPYSGGAQKRDTFDVAETASKASGKSRPRGKRR